MRPGARRGHTTRPGIRYGRVVRPPDSCSCQVVVPWFRGSSPMSHSIPSRLFQTLKSHRWNCSVCRRCQKLTVLNYLRLLGGELRKGSCIDNAAGHTTRARPRNGRIRSPIPRPRCPRPRPSRRTSRNPRRSRGSRPRWGSGPPGSRGSRRSRRAGTGPRNPGS